MILSYDESIRAYGSDYKLKKELAAGNIYQLEKGLYSDRPRCTEKAIISFKYPRAVFSGESAFYYHGLTDVIPDSYTLATRRQDSRIKQKNINQIFIRNDLFDMGIEVIDSNGDEIRIYNLERMLIELVRSRTKYSLNYYKEIIGNYRNRIYSMDFGKLEEYASKFKSYDRIMNTIQMEVL